METLILDDAIDIFSLDFTYWWQRTSSDGNFSALVFISILMEIPNSLQRSTQERKGSNNENYLDVIFEFVTKLIFEMSRIAYKSQTFKN